MEKRKDPLSPAPSSPEENAPRKGKKSPSSVKDEPKFVKEKKLFKKRSLFRQFRIFRQGGLGVVDSFFNSLYIILSEKSVEKEEKKLQSKGESVDARHFLELHTMPLRIFSSFAKRVFGIFSAVSAPRRKKDQSHAHRSKALFIKKHLPHFLILVLGIALAFYIRTTLNSPLVFRAEINGRLLGVVEDKYTVDSAIDALEDNAEIVLGKSFHFPGEVTYSIQRSRSDSFTSKEDISRQLYTYVEDYICTAAGLYVDDVLVAVCKDEEEIRLAIDAFFRRHQTQDTGGIFNDIRVETQAYPTETIISSEALSLLLDEMKTPLEERKKENAPENSPLPSPEEELDSIPAMSILSDVSLPEKQRNFTSSHYPRSIEKIKLDFFTTEDSTYETELAYDTVYVESDNHYTSMADTTVKGENGLARVTARVYFVDGKEVKREILTQTILREPVDHVVSIGTKLLPEEMGVTSFTSNPGRFIVPRVGYVSSYFGAREEGYHKGWDIPGDEGDNLYAAASGTVVVAISADGHFSDRPNHLYTGYGHCVVIQHEDGYSTMYAHCSAVNVTLGQKVKQGDKIAEVGNTGKSDGPHVHFEIIKDEVALNPELYLYKGDATIYNKK